MVITKDAPRIALCLTLAFSCNLNLAMQKLYAGRHKSHTKHRHKKGRKKTTRVIVHNPHGDHECLLCSRLMEKSNEQLSTRALLNAITPQRRGKPSLADLFFILLTKYTSQKLTPKQLENSLKKSINCPIVSTILYNSIEQKNPDLTSLIMTS